MTAGVAVDAQEAVGQHATLEIGADLALDEAGKPIELEHQRQRSRR